MNRKEYRDGYLKSVRWKSMQRYKDSYCFCCRDRWETSEWNQEKEDKEHLELHHFSYKNMNTDLEKYDLITVCSLCHDDIHESVELGYSKLEDAHFILRDKKNRKEFRDEKINPEHISVILKRVLRKLDDKRNDS